MPYQRIEVRKIGHKILEVAAPAELTSSKYLFIIYLVYVAIIIIYCSCVTN